MPLSNKDGIITQPWFRFFGSIAAAVSAGGPVAAGVASFMGRVGVVVLNAADVVTALGYTPGTVKVSGFPSVGQTAVWVDSQTVQGISGSTTGMTAVVALARGQLVAFTASGAILADATDATKPAMGYALVMTSAGGSVPIGLAGSVNQGIGLLTPGAPYFLSTGGGVTATVPTTGANQFVGYATPGGNLAFDPGADMSL